LLRQPAPAGARVHVAVWAQGALLAAAHAQVMEAYNPVACATAGAACAAYRAPVG
jgi:hypothetical protein